MKKEIKAKNGMKAIGPYSQGITIGDFVFCSGNIGIDPKTNSLVGGIKAQTKQALTNLKSVLEAGGSDINNVLKTTVYLEDMDEFNQMNEVYATFFHTPYPARATIQVARLPKDALVEIECIAYRKSSENYCGGECKF